MSFDVVYANTPEKHRIIHPKNILLMLPEADYDWSWFSKTTGLTRFEVAITYPKDGVNFLDEICLIAPKLVIQLGTQQTRKYPFAGSGPTVSVEMQTLINKALADRFVGLHHHDEYSLKDGLGTVENLTKMLKKQKRSFCSVTNHGSIGGWIRQYNACQKNGIKPIFGMEGYVNNYRGEDPELLKENRSANHILLLAKNREGFDNLIRIHNDAQLNGFYYTPRADHNAFKQWGKGICATSACFAGEIPRALMADDWEKAEGIYNIYKECFENVFIEVQIIEFEAQRELNRRLIQFADGIGAPLILACDSHYLDPEHAETHDLLMYMRQGKTILDVREKGEDVWEFDVRNLFYRNAEQMEKVYFDGFVDRKGKSFPPFKDDVFTEERFREAMDNTLKVAREIEDIKLDSSIKLPKLSDDSVEQIKHHAWKGFARLGLDSKPNKRDYEDRLKYELDVICRLGWADYFLVMERIVHIAMDEYKEIAGDFGVGAGRGSSAGSLVAWCLGITDCDPLKHGLLFERFLDESRTDPPDIDTDFHPSIRDSVKDRIVKEFGREKTCNIGTYSTYKTRAAIVDIARVLGNDVNEIMAITKKMEPLRGYENEEGEETIVDKMDIEELCKIYPELDAYFQKYPAVAVHFEIIRNQIKNMGKHAGGMLISGIDLTGKIPVQLDKDGNIISSWCESGSTAELSSVGMVKFDILGLSNLSVISDCIKLIKENRGIEIKRWEIPDNDRLSIVMEGKSEMKGIFQFENPSTMDIVKRVGMDSLADVAAITSLLRPGPKDMGMHLEYAERKHGKTYDMPKFMRDLLKETHGILIFQEQIMLLSREVAGFTMAEANQLRKGMGKKKKDVIEKMRAKFLEGAKKKRVETGEMTMAEVEQIFAFIESFAAYGFNKSHAISYSMITTYEIWLKHNYFKEYMTALMLNTGSNEKRHGMENVLAEYVTLAKKRGVKVLPPNINAPKSEFYIDADGCINFGLDHVKQVSSSAAKIVEITKVEPFKSMADFYERCSYESEVASGKNAGKKRITKPTKAVVENLIYAGAFDRLGTRRDMLREYYLARGKKEVPPQPTDPELDENEIEVIGFCLSKPPVYEKFLEQMRDNKWYTISQQSKSKKVTLVGRIDSVTAKTSKAGNQMYVVKMVDGIDSINFFVFKGDMEYFRDNIKKGQIAAIPMSKFDDSETRFFDGHGEITILD